MTLFVVRRQTAAVLLDDPVLPAEQRRPPARAGIALAGAVGPDQHLARGGFAGGGRAVTWIADAGERPCAEFNQPRNPESRSATDTGVMRS